MMKFTRSTAAMLPSFISLNNNNELYKKRGHKRVIYSIYKQKREHSSQRTNLSQTKQRNTEYTNIQLHGNLA